MTKKKSLIGVAVLSGLVALGVTVKKLKKVPLAPIVVPAGKRPCDVRFTDGGRETIFLDLDAGFMSINDSYQHVSHVKCTPPGRP